MVERFHRSLKAALKARLIGNNWVEQLPWVLLGLRTAPKEDLGYSSAELVYGEPLTVPGEFTLPQAWPWSATEFLTVFEPRHNSSNLDQLSTTANHTHTCPHLCLQPSMFTYALTPLRLHFKDHTAAHIQY